MADADERGPNWLQIRKRIDEGDVAGSNVPPEPATATFGTDDEAAGHYTAPADIARSAGPEASPPSSPPRSRTKAAWAWSTAVLLVVLGVMAVLLVA